MKRLKMIGLLGWLCCGVLAPATGQGITGEQREQAAALIAAARASDEGYRRMAALCDTFGPRISGSENLERAIDWILDRMREDGFRNVRGEPVRVPHWIRGMESLQMTAPHRESLPMLGLGGSVATPPGGITAETLVVSSFDELRAQADRAVGKIVVFNVPFTEYRRTVVVRTRGAIEAAKAGAVASLIRSVGPVSLQTPHTGGMSYQDGIPKIPHAAITLEDAKRLHRFQARGVPVTLSLRMEARWGEERTSRNVIADLPGRESPDEVVVISGHIDSWDVGQGAQDDAGGCLVAWEAARLIHSLGLRPRRTIRVVLWTNEEHGTRGAKQYVANHRDALDRHILAIESDTGIGQPSGFAFTGSEQAGAMVRSVAESLRGIDAGTITLGAGGADVRHLLVEGVPIMDLSVDRSRYFWYHHTHADTVDKVDPQEFRNCVATMAVMALLVAEMEVALPR